MVCTWKIVSCEDDKESYVFYSKLGTESFLSGKLCAQIYQLNKASIGTKVCRIPNDAGCYFVTYSTYDMDCNKVCG